VYVNVRSCREILAFLVLLAFENGSEKYYEILRILLGYRPQGVCALAKYLPFLYFSRENVINH